MDHSLLCPARRRKIAACSGSRDKLPRPHQRRGVKELCQPQHVWQPELQSSVASSVILVLNNFETGQLTLAIPANLANIALSAPGIFASSVRWTDVMAKPSPCFSRVTSALASVCSTMSSASPRIRDSVMNRQHALHRSALRGSNLACLRSDCRTHRDNPLVRRSWSRLRPLRPKCAPAIWPSRMSSSWLLLFDYGCLSGA